MNRSSGAFGLLRTNGKLDTLVSAGILAFVVRLLALMLAVVVIAVVMPLALQEGSPGITADVEADEAFVRSVALAGQNSVGYAVAGPCSAPCCTLSISPAEAEAYAWSLAQTVQGSVGLVGGQ